MSDPQLSQSQCLYLKHAKSLAELRDAHKVTLSVSFALLFSWVWDTVVREGMQDVGSRLYIEFPSVGLQKLWGTILMPYSAVAGSDSILENRFFCLRDGIHCCLFRNLIMTPLKFTGVKIKSRKAKFGFSHHTSILF